MPYIAILIFLLLVTALVHKGFHLTIYQKNSHMIVVNAFMLIVGVIWDTYAITQGHWTFPPDKVIGLYVGVMPLEEYMFIFIITYFILVTYHFVTKKL